jgi:hypothetical protein
MTANIVPVGISKEILEKTGSGEPGNCTVQFWACTIHEFIKFSGAPYQHDDKRMMTIFL